MRHVLGFDIGGHAIKGGRFSEQGDCLVEISIPTPQTPADVLAALAALSRQLDPQHTTVAIGVGVPGPTDGYIAIHAINLPGWRNIPVAQTLGAATGLPVVLGNDANCAGLGEAWRGAGQGAAVVLMLTLGTGVGGAIILDGQLYTGMGAAGGELGLMTLYPEGQPCNSGNTGSLEQYVSATAIQRRTGLDCPTLAQKAALGDATAQAHWQAIGRDLGIGLSSLIYIFAPERLIIGGGVSHCSAWFMPSAIAEVEQRVLPSSRSQLQILTASLGNRAGMIGAARLALDLDQ